jgi:hypothetical protein
MLHTFMQRSENAAACACKVLVSAAIKSQKAGVSTPVNPGAFSSSTAVLGQLAAYVRKQITINHSVKGQWEEAGTEKWWNFWGQQLTVERLVAGEVQAWCLEKKKKCPGYESCVELNLGLHLETRQCIRWLPLEIKEKAKATRFCTSAATFRIPLLVKDAALPAFSPCTLSAFSSTESRLKAHTH